VGEGKGRRRGRGAKGGREAEGREGGRRASQEEEIHQISRHVRRLSIQEEEPVVVALGIGTHHVPSLWML